MYPKASPMAGVILRSMVQTLRQEAKIRLPIHSHILVACSAGPDSMVLAHALVTYGRRMVRRDRIHLLYVDHGWRKEAKDEAQFLRGWCKAQKVKFHWDHVPKVSKKTRPGVDSPESAARSARKKLFEKWRKKPSRALF